MAGQADSRESKEIAEAANGAELLFHLAANSNGTISVENIRLFPVSRRLWQRSAEIREQNVAKGFKVIGHYWTQGQYDLVTIVEAPTEDAMMEGLFAITEAGNASSETLHAFTDEDMQRILG